MGREPFRWGMVETSGPRGETAKIGSNLRSPRGNVNDAAEGAGSPFPRAII
jgi:hypothetical protein